MKPRLFNGSEWIEFDTEAEHDAYIAANFPNPPTNFILQQARREQLGRELVADLGHVLQEQNLTQADEAAIVNKIATVITALAAGFIRGARIICNALTTDSVFTPGRKNYLLNRIDETISQL